MQSKMWKGQCVYIKKREFEEIEDMETEKGNSRFQYITETPDKL